MSTLKEWVEDAVAKCIRPQWEKIQRATLDGDAIVIAYEPDTSNPSVASLLATLGADRQTFQQMTRTRARRIFVAPVDPATCRWMTSRVPSGQARIMLVTKGAYFLLNHTKDRGFWAEADTWTAPSDK
jgi:hypothetical protein